MADWMLDPPDGDLEQWDRSVTDEFDGIPYDEDWGDGWEGEEYAADAASQ